MDDDSSGVFVIMLIIMIVVSLFVRSCGVGELSKIELDNITNLSDKVCKNNDGVRYIDFFPSSEYEITVYCNNGAVFKDVKYGGSIVK
jgi:hypothetical protein